MFRPWPHAAFVTVAAAVLVAIVGVAAWRLGGGPRGASGGYQRRLGATSGNAEMLCESSCHGCSFEFEGPVFDLKNEFVLIFNHGKVGSCTLRDSLRASVLNGSWLIALTAGAGRWSLNPELLERAETALPQFAGAHSPRAAQLYLSRVPAGRRVWILTACRNPFKYLVSLFWEVFKGKRFKWQQGLEIASNTSVDVVLDHFGKEMRSHMSTGSFFGDHGLFRSTIGVDLAVCGVKFSGGVLYIDRVAHGVRQSIVLLRLEDIKHWPAILGKFMPGFRLVAGKNVRDMFSHHHLADAVDARWVWPEKDVRDILRWDTWKFYTAQENIAMLRDLKMNGST